MEDISALVLLLEKVLAFSYWWPTLNKDVVEMCQTCDIC